MEELSTLVKSRREAMKLSQEELASRAGTSQATIDKIENNRSARSKFLPAIFSILDLPLDLLLTDRRKEETYYKPNLAAQRRIPKEDLVGIPDLPIYSSVRGGSWADSVLVSPEAIDYVKRPEPLAKARNGYGLYIVGDSMEPAYRQGDLALIHPNLPAKAGDEVVICSIDNNGEYYAIIKLLTKVTADKWHLRQYNPGPDEEADFTLNREEWPICHLVVGNYRRR